MVLKKISTFVCTLNGKNKVKNFLWKKTCLLRKSNPSNFQRLNKLNLVDIWFDITYQRSLRRSTINLAILISLFARFKGPSHEFSPFFACGDRSRPN
jgi:hypothetical protein